MSLLLLFNGSNPPPSASTSEPYVTVLLETAPNVFADVSADLRSGYTNRGRQAELARYQPGTCTLELSNQDRAYDSTVNSYIKPGRRLQVLGSYAGTTYPQFTGKVDGWAEKSNGPNDAVAIVQATDAFKDFNKADLPSSAYYLEVLEDVPVAWYHLSDTEGSTQFSDSQGGIAIDVIGSPALGLSGLISRESDGAMSTDADFEGASVLGKILTGGPLTLEMVWAGTGDGDLFSQASETTVDGFSMGLMVSGEVFFEPGIGVFGGLVIGPVINDGLTHHIVGTWDVDETVKLYVDGVEVDSSAATQGNFTTNTHRISIAGFTLPNGQQVKGAQGTYDEIAIYDHALSAERVAAHAGTASTPWNNDLPGERLTRLADFLAIPESLRDFDEGNSVLQSATLGMSVLEHAQKVAESEFGFLYIKGDGTVVFEDRHSILNQTSQGTFSDQPNAALVYKDSTPKYDDTLIRNDVSVSRSEGVAQRVEDTDSIAEYGRYSFTLDGLFHDSDDLSLDAGEFILSEYSEPKRRIENVTLGPFDAGKAASMFPQMLGRELTEWITITEHPQRIDPVITQVSVIESISQSFGPKHWQTKWNVSPSLVGAFWQIGVPGFSEIGLTTRVYF